MDSNKMCGFNDKWFSRTPASTIIKEYETRTLMNDAVTEIMATYDKDQLKEIADHGCQSGVCSQHIYYGDTIKFFDTYEDEIVEYIESNYGTEFLVSAFSDADADLTSYKNWITWCFIEMIAFRVTEEALEEPEITSYGAVA